MIEALSRVARAEDFTSFEQEDLNLICDLGLLEGQHPMRAWEYAVVLEAVRRWDGGTSCPGHPPRPWASRDRLALDVGGAGSRLWKALEARGWKPEVLDPACPPYVPLEGYRGRPAPLVTCVSVLEHVEDVGDFLKRLAGVTAPGGLLVLTMDYHPDGDHERDSWHFHWMRRRIFGPLGLGIAGGTLAEEGFRLPDGTDLTWQGPTVYDYGFASLVLVKEE